MGCGIADGRRNGHAGSTRHALHQWSGLRAPPNPRWIPWIFAAKTTAAGLLALLVAFTFDLDQPKWALLTVFIVAQPQSGLVLAKSFYRIIGTLVGAAGALFLVALFAQERILFLGSLAIWVGLCTFASRRARNFAAYGFVLSGYTVAIVGISGALAPANAFFIAVARVTEISIGIGATAAISHLVLPVSLADSLRRAIAAGRLAVADYALAFLNGRATSAQRSKLLDQVMAIEKLRASAVFEDRDIRARSAVLRSLDMAMLGVVDVANLPVWPPAGFPRTDTAMGPGFDEALAKSAAAIDLWRRDEMDAAGLSCSFVRARAALPIARDLFREPSLTDEEVITRTAAIARLREILAVFQAFTAADETALASQPRPTPRPRVPVANDGAQALWAGLRAALALLLVATFWIEANWASGSTAAILATLVTARLATMERAVLAALGGTIVTVLAALPTFLLVEVALPRASGFAMFALVVAPMLFFCAFLMAREKTAGLGFVAGLYFANVGAFQDRMAYDPIGFINTSLAITLAIATAAVLFAVIDPDTAHAARRRFARAVHRALDRIGHCRRPIARIELETIVTDALGQLRQSLHAGQAEDVAAIEAGAALLGIGRELIRLRDDGRPMRDTVEVTAAVVRVISGDGTPALDRAQRAVRNAVATRLSELRADRLGVAEARAAVRELVALAAIGDQLERGTALLGYEPAKRTRAHAA